MKFIEVSVVVPAYNEELTIVEAMNRISSVFTQAGIPFEIIVVSDGSSDGTVSVLTEAQLIGVQVIDNDINVGKGAALRMGTQHASGKYLAFHDADLDLHPEALLGLFHIIESTKADGVIGSKIHPESSVHYPALRRIMSFCFRLLIRRIFDLRVSDTQTGVKIFKREKVSPVICSVETDGFGFDLELLVRMHQLGMTVVEGPIILDYQFKSSIGISTVGVMFKDLFRLKKIIKRSM